MVLKVFFLLGRRFPSFDYKTLEADPEAIWKHVLEQVPRDEMCILSRPGESRKITDSIVPLKGGITLVPRG